MNKMMEQRTDGISMMNKMRVYWGSAFDSYLGDGDANYDPDD